MGLTYKALKYRDIKKNVTNAKAGGMAVVDADAETIAQQQAATLSITASTAQVNATTTIMPENQQQQFTADHIMKLCLFLAEKSRAKQLQQSQQMDARRFYENFLQEATESAEEEQMLCDNDAATFHKHMTNFENKFKPSKNKTHIPPPHQTSPRAIRRTKMKSEKHIKQSVLTDKISTSSSSNLLNYNTLPDVCEKTHEDTQNYEQPQQHQQDKRDILLKIRQQIFERKRLRQLLSGGQRQHAQYPLGTQHHHQQQQQQLNNDYNNAQLQQQVELQRLADVWRPW